MLQKGLHIIFPRESSSCPSAGPLQFLQCWLLLQSTAQAWALRGVLCQLPFGWLAALSGISGKRDLREFEPVWVEEGGRHGLDSGPVLPHPPPPPFVQLQTLSSFHPWSARLGAPGTLETHAPQSHHIHPHKSSLSLHSFLCFSFCSCDLYSAMNSPLVSHFCLISAPLQTLFLLPLPSFLSCFIHVFSFLHLKARKVLSHKEKIVSPPVRILCSSLLAGLISTWMCHDEVFWTPTMTNKISFCQWWQAHILKLA